MRTLWIDGRRLELDDRRRLNAIEAAKLLGIDIPHYCWHPGLSVVGSCRMCLVEAGRRDPASGAITMEPKLVPACTIQAADGLVLVTQSEKVARARAMVEEDLLLRHPIDCPICDKAGECRLQDYHFLHGQKERRADLRPFTSRRRDLGDVTLFVDRCILCSRCVRFTAEVTGTRELIIVGRGTHEEIDVAENLPLNNRLSGNVVDLCPVGALADKDFLYKQRVWFLRSHPGVCTRCATGCSIWIEENQDRIYRIRPRENPAVNQWWICNDGRYDYPHVHNPRRLLRPTRREGERRGELDWTGLPAELASRLAAARPLGAVLSPMLTVEEAYLLGGSLRAIDPAAVLALGPVPRVGEDERFPKGFVIRAEKCPNRRGVEAILAHLGGEVVSWDALVAAAEAGRFGAVWISGGYRDEWIDATTARRLRGARLLIVQDLFPSPLAELADYALPAAASAEKQGAYVNARDHLQAVDWAIRPPAGVRPEGSLFWEMSGRSGLFQAEKLLAEIAREVLFFSAAAGGVGPLGVDLRANLLASATAAGGSATADSPAATDS